MRFVFIVIDRFDSLRFVPFLIRRYPIFIPAHPEFQPAPFRRATIFERFLLLPFCVVRSAIRASMGGGFDYNRSNIVGSVSDSRMVASIRGGAAVG